jgi:nitroreductase
MKELNLQTTIRERRSIRRFEDRAIEPEKLAEIFEAVRWAPSWGNCQCWELIVVEAQEDREKLAELVSKKNPATLAVRHAPVVLALCGQAKKSGYYNGRQMTRFPDWLMYDLGLASQNICLTAHGLGLGSVIVGLFDHEKVAEMLAVPDGIEVVSLIPLGYPAHNPSAPVRRASEEFVHYGRF